MTALPAPPRFQHRSLAEYLGLLLVLALVLSSLAATAPSAQALGNGIARLFAPSGLLMQMFPPDFTRIVPIGWKLLETLQMAVAGCALGLLFAIPRRRRLPRARGRSTFSLSGSSQHSRRFFAACAAATRQRKIGICT